MPETPSDADSHDAGEHADAERGPHDKAREGLEHLQAAARELIQAARSMLDVAEDLVNDPEAVASVAATVGALGDLVRHRAGGSAPPPQPGDRPGGDGDSGVERITVV